MPGAKALVYPPHPPSQRHRCKTVDHKGQRLVTKAFEHLGVGVDGAKGQGGVEQARRPRWAAQAAMASSARAQMIEKASALMSNAVVCHASIAA